MRQFILNRNIEELVVNNMIEPTAAESFLPFALPDIGEDEIAEVIDTLRSGWLTSGPKTLHFEQKFSEFLGNGVECIAVNSATAGLHLALESIGLAPGDEVITTPLTFTATAAAARHLGAHPVFVDVDPLTFNIDPAKIEAAISTRTKAIVPVHFAGLACDMDAILSIARRYGLMVVEDAAHSLPTLYRGKMIGTLDSDVTVFSFYATKTITTGEGGMIVTRNPETAARCRTMRLHGISRDAFDRHGTPHASWQYEVVAPGFKYNTTDMASSLGIHQLKKIWLFQRRRQEMADRYNQELSDLPLKLPPSAREGDVHAWHLYVIRLHSSAGIERDQFISQMSKRGVGCSVHFIPLHLHPYWRDIYGLKPGLFPIAMDMYEAAISLPLYTRMSDDDQSRVIDAIKDILS